ncbi:hypothetical protein AB0940_29425 [Streptomyces sp. NPDC006656]|uniref:hypothetical protein n=1 Tax=Streptomyces sp. NPDC006656 TaxID=3156899 RepID=UPI0034532A8B
MTSSPHTSSTGADFGDGTQNSKLSGGTVTQTAAYGVNVGEADDYHQSSTALVTLNDTVAQNRITMRAARSWSMP